MIENCIAKTHPELLKYFVNIEDTYQYNIGEHNKVKVKCPDCGFEKEMRISNLYYQGFGCKRCNTGGSLAEKIMFNILRYLHIDFKDEICFDWCKYEFKNKIRKGRYDFYIPSMNLIIEMDGEFHFKYNRRSGQTAEESQYIDNEKDRLAKEHGIEVIRIDCNYDKHDRFNYIKTNILKSHLSNILNMNILDWDYIIKESTTNKIVKVCKLWSDGIGIEEISKRCDCTDVTVRTYLKKGTEFGWCKYIPMVGNQSKIRKSTKPRQFICLENNMIFNGISECAKQSEEVFGVKLNISKICEVLNGARKHHHNLHFKFI